MEKLLFIIIIIISGLNPSTAFADILYFKDKEVLENVVVKRETTDTIVVNIGVGSFTFSKNEIEKIERTTTEENEKILQARSAKSDNTPEEVLESSGESESTTNESTLYLRINPMIELDFKSKEEIYELRRQYVAQYPGLVVDTYEPSAEVFGDIESGKPWWGILGLCYYGPGQKSIEGLSEESRFIANPYILVGLDEGHAYVIKDKNLRPKAVYPKPTTLVWKKEEKWAKVTYAVRRFWKEAQPYEYLSLNDRTFDLYAYNARDLGFQYLHVDNKQSRNAISLSTSGGALLIPFMLHVGGSCGYEGGGNNMSPDTPDFKIQISKLPARLYIKLWKVQPASNDEPEDMTFIIDMI
ncbi:MAG: hypothetical protein KKH94_08345 [Candidatus Omnitrophica bacterium]|nr:hypothetical protein [Candidatus Omnitrophota bacterium]